MTSSLVGSEMCIRDSFNVSQPPPPTKDPGSAARITPTSQSRVVTVKSPCLLYTSDAADDCSV
eukprot:10806631-Prorocentrum_lima.AAC.1